VHLLPLTTKYQNITKFLVDRTRIRRIIRSIQPDIVHVHTTIMYAYAALERGYPSVLAIRGLVQREAPLERGKDRLRMSKFAANFERDALRRAKNIICLNRYTSSFITDCIQNPQIRYIDNPADDSFFDIKNQEEEGRMLLLAPVRRLKGHEFAVQAAAELKAQGHRINLYLVGPPVDESYLAEIRTMIDALGVDDCVHIENSASRAAAREHYSRASVVLLPSLIENAPLVVSEGMAAGKAIVATPAGGVAEMIEDGKSGVIVPMSDSKALAAGIARLLDSPQMRREMGAAAKQVAEQRFRKEVSVEKTLAFYRDILAQAN
jgi:glycosyltransferase involved in cell wall biosynthesis